MLKFEGWFVKTVTLATAEGKLKFLEVGEFSIGKCFAQMPLRFYGLVWDV